MGKIKNMETKKVINLTGEIAVQPGQVISKTLAQNDHVSLTLFSFSQDEEISTHSSQGDAMIQVLEGQARITIDKEVFEVEAGKSIIMPSGHPHAVYALKDMKMLLTVIF